MAERTVVAEYPEHDPDNPGYARVVQRMSDGSYQVVPGKHALPSAAPAAPAAAPMAGGMGGDWADLWRSLTGSNQERFDWDKERFGRQQYGDLAQSLLAGASSLRGPADWQRYAQYTSGGQDIFNRLFGSASAPSFGAPTGFSEPMTIQRLLQDLGLVQGGDGGISDAQIQQWAQGLNDPVAFERGREFVNTYGRLPQTLDEWNAFKSGGGGVQAQSNPMTAAMQAATAPITGDDRLSIQPVNEPQPFPSAQPAGVQAQPVPAGQQQPMVPLPHHINPAVWDSMSPTAKQMILSAAESGHTSSGAWDPTDFLTQMQAARPQGVAPRRTSMSWGAPQGMFG